jgi:L-amino acid N-acyltransferase YncA
VTIIPDSKAIRPVDLTDLDWLFGLRNNPEFAKWFRSPGSVSYPEHQVWFKKILHAGYELFDVIEVDGLQAGYVRLEASSSSDKGLLRFEVSIGVDPLFQGKGLASFLMQHALNHRRNERLTIEYSAQVHELNNASCHLFLKFDFVKDFSELVSNGFATYRLQRNSIG